MPGSPRPARLRPRESAPPGRERDPARVEEARKIVPPLAVDAQNEAANNSFVAYRHFREKVGEFKALCILIEGRLKHIADGRADDLRSDFERMDILMLGLLIWQGWELSSIIANERGSSVIVGVAAFNLLLDFDFVERGIEAGLPRHMEWYAAFGLLVTLIWLYLELLRLLAKLQSRD